MTCRVYRRHACSEDCRALATHSIDAISWGNVELESEVRAWLEDLPTAYFARAAFCIDLLADQGVLLGEPHTRQLDGKIRELRFYLERDAVRVTYWIASERRIILLTVFRKTRMREDREVERARRAFERCVTERHIVTEGMTLLACRSLVVLT
ncbi:type II toxin-antitoxin system RelE/ParE family toxin [Micromonospora sp. DT4]|uniref:type II toxin-antitoxin system RelE/ParE family toxin n=1 Tax=Micromonospora sp. DT4 TaxID=3393438 RepID=UPI003CF82849